MSDQRQSDALRSGDVYRSSTLSPKGPTEANVLIVAHPDDESLWCCGRVLAERGKWDLICVSHPIADPKRVEQFWNATQILGFRNVWLGAGRDLDATTPIDVQLPPLNHYGVVLTHNERGEYGHMHHKQVHAAVKMQRHDLVCFGWGMPDPNVELQLPTGILAKKIEALQCYGSWFDRLVKTFFRGDPRNLAKETYVDRGVRL
jgi:LmbE family N-acetylglucosaminyl deacetylase